MPSRRFVVFASGAAIATVGTRSAFSQNADRPNPMPDELRKALEHDPTSPVLGNPDGNVTLTEFFDYNCSFCRKMTSRLQRLIGSDPQLRVVLREWPVFGEGSEFAARASLASLDQRKYWAFHSALLSMKGRAVEATVMRTAREVGLDVDKLQADMTAPHIDKHLEMTTNLAEHMGLVGTPTFVAGDEGIFGEMSQEELGDLVARARSTLGVPAG